MAPKIPVLAASQQQPPPPHPWPSLDHFSVATIIAIVIVLLAAGFLLRLLGQLLRQRLARRNGFVLETGHNAAAPVASYSYTTLNHHANTQPIHRPKTRKPKPRPTSHAELEARQLLFPPAEAARPGERVPLCNPRPAARASLYDTFQIPPPDGPRLKVARSMMELNGEDASGAEPPAKDARKSKTIHWHGVNKLNTAWGWMS